MIETKKEKQAKRVYLETYGCQMNEYDSELVKSILANSDYEITTREEDADVILLNTCAIRENAHDKIYARLGDLKHLKNSGNRVVIGLLGCMAQNLRGNLERSDSVVDIYAGPDSYKRLPAMIDSVRQTGRKGFDFNLSEFEDYSDVYPKRVPGVNAWIAVMRGCDNFCTFCVVPYTRGRERSRSLQSVVSEAKRLVSEGFKQVTLLGQNVNSYRSHHDDFADLMAAVASVDGLERVRFTSPHPKDFPEKLLKVMAEHAKICNHVHLPLQAGSDRVLEMMARTYTKKSFLALVDKIRDMVPGVTLTTDVIVGFPTETDAEFEETVEVMEKVQFDSAFTFKYSERQNTIAYRKFPDDVTEAQKTERIVRLVELQKEHSLHRNYEQIGKTVKVLIENHSKRNVEEWMGRTDGNRIVVLKDDKGGHVEGSMVDVTIRDATPHTLFGELHDACCSLHPQPERQIAV